MITHARRLLLLTLITALLAGCGYGVSGSLPEHIKTVAVPVFKNKTQEPAVEHGITSAVVTAFVNSGRLKVVPLDQADAVLDGEIVGYAIEPLTFDRRLNAREYRLRVVLNIEFRVVGQVSDTISREEGAVRQAAVEIGRKLVTQVVDRF